jgi:hypothetical protein
MQASEKAALAGILSTIRPKLSIEVGIYWGGSLSLTARYVDKVIAIDIDAEVTSRFEVAANIDIRIGGSLDILPKVLSEISAAQQPLSFVLIDADHSAEGVRRDIEMILTYSPIVPMVILMHDSGNPACREGILTANWEANPHVQSVEIDFVPGQVIEHSVTETSAEIWGGMALAYLTPERRASGVYIGQSARTSIQALHSFCRNMTASSPQT